MNELIKSKKRKSIIHKFNNKRFNKKCFICDKIYYVLEIHHIDKDFTNNNDDNLLLICTQCHDLIHNKKIIDNDNPTKKRYLINLFRKKLGVKNE